MTLFLLGVLIVSCGKESSEADPTLVSDPSAPIGSTGPTTPVEISLNQDSGQSDPTSTFPINFRIVFLREINTSTFDNSDITNLGTATGVTWAITNSGDNIVFNIAATSAATQGTIVPHINAGVLEDNYGNQNIASVSFDNTVNYDLDLLVTIDQKSGQSDPTQVGPVEFDVIFNGPIDASTFVPADVTQNGTAPGVIWTIINSGDDRVFTLQATGMTGSGTIIPSLAAGVVQSNAPVENNLASTSTDDTVTYNHEFDVTVEQKGAQADPTSSLPIEYDVIFSEAINAATFTTADIVQNGTASGITWNIINSGDDTNFTLQATAVTVAGTLIPSFNGSVIQTASLKDNTASTSTDNSVTYTTTFDVTIDQSGSQLDPTASLPINYDVVFSTAIDASSFVVGDITQNGTATGVTWNIINSGDDTNFTLQATAISTEGTVIPSIAAGVVNDPGSASNNVSTSTDPSVTYMVDFTTTIEQKGSQADPTASLPIEFDVVFERTIDPSTFVVGDISQGGTATGITWNIINSGDDTNFTLQATAITGPGTVVPSVNVGLVSDPTGGTSLASSSVDNSVSYTLNFTVTVDQKGAQADPSSSLPIEWDVVFSEAIDPTTFLVADITQNGTATGITWNILNSGDDTNFTLQATAVTGEGTLIPSIAVNMVQSPAAANNLASTSTDGSVLYNTTFDVTVDQKGAQADPAQTLPIEYDVVFTEAIDASTFVVGDITQNGTATGITWNIINSGDDTNFTLQATAVTGVGTLIPSIDLNLVQTTYSANNTASTSTDASVTYDPVIAVTIDQKGAQADPAKTLPVEFDVVFDSAIDASTFIPADVTQNGTATGVTWNIINSGDDTNFTLQATAVTGEGTIIPSIAANLVQNPASWNNTASTSTDDTVFYRTTFDVTVEQKGAQADPATTFNIEYDVVFSEAIDASTFVAGDIAQGGTATGVTWNIINSGDDINFTLQATGATGAGTIIPTVTVNSVQTPDVINNNVSTSTDNSVLYAPNFDVTVDQKGAQADPTAGTPVEFDVVFSEAIDASTFVVGDVTQNGTATGITWNIINSGDDTNFTLQATAVTGDGTIIPSLAQGVTANSLGGLNTVSTATDNSVLFNATFEVTIDQKGAQADPAKTLPVEFDVVFSEAIDASTFVVGDVTQNGTATGVTWNIINSGDDTNFTLQATAVTGEGTIIPSLALSTVQTSYSSNNTASTSTDNSVFYRTSFDVTIDQKGAQADPTASFNIEYDVVFSEAIDASTFVVGDVTQNGTATGITWNIINSGDDINFTLQATAATGEGTIIPSLASSTVQTSDTINNNASTATDNSVTYSLTFDVTIDQKGAQADPAKTLPVEFDVVFSTAIDASTFVVGDISQGGTATGVTWNIINSGDDINFTLQATAVTGEGTIIPSIAANLVQTSNSADNTLSTSTDNSVFYRTSFDVTIDQKGAQTDPTSTFNVEFDVVFSEAISAASFVVGDITQNGTAPGVVWNIVNSGDDINFTLQATTASNEGTIIPSLASSTILTADSINNNASTSTDNSVLYLPPVSVTVDQKAGQLDPAGTFNVEFDVVFSAAINDGTFTTGDITQNGTATGVTWNIVNSGDDINYTLQATGVTADGTIIPSINLNLVQTVAGANNSASTSTDNSVTLNQTFDVTIDQKGAQADPAASVPVEFDVVFSEAIDASTFVVGDITQSGTATGVTWNLINSGDDINFTLQATAASDGTLIPTLAANTVQTSYSANNAVSTATDNSVTLDTSFTITLTLTGADNIVADGVTTTTLQANVKNSEATNISGETVTLNIPTNGGTVPGTVVSDGSGNANFTLTSSIVAGTYLYTAGAGGDTSPGTNVTFVAGPVASVALSLTGAAEIAADGVATTTFDATVTDANGNPNISETVTFNIPTNGGTVPGTVNTNGSGVATFTLTSSTTVGLYSYTATASAITSSSVNAEFKTAILTVTTSPSLDFGTWVNSISDSRQVIITNTGLMPTNVLSGSITGNNAKHLQWSTDTCNGATLNPTQTCNIIFLFDGTDNPNGAKAETYTLTGAPGGTIILNLTGDD